MKRALPVGSVINCADNSPAKTFQIIGFLNLQGSKKRRLSGGVGSVARAVVRKGAASVKGKVHYILIVRQKAAFTRPKEGKVRFEDNAGILLDQTRHLKKSIIKGVIAKQIRENPWYKEIAAIPV